MYLRHMCDLFARVAQSSGRFNVLLATREPETIASEPEAAARLATVGGPWLVILWDNWTATGVLVAQPEDMAQYEQPHDERAVRLQETRSRPGDRPAAYGMRWSEVTQVLQEMHHLAPHWCVTGIECVGHGPSPRYAVAMQSRATMQRLVFASTAAFRAALSGGAAA